MGGFNWVKSHHFTFDQLLYYQVSISTSTGSDVKKHSTPHSFILKTPTSPTSNESRDCDVTMLYYSWRLKSKSSVQSSPPLHCPLFCPMLCCYLLAQRPQLTLTNWLCGAALLTLICRSHHFMILITDNITLHCCSFSVCDMYNTIQPMLYPQRSALLCLD